MKHKLLAAAGLAAIMAVPTAASAQLFGTPGDDAGFYLRGQAGYGSHTDIDLDGAIVGEVESEGNGIGSLGAGYDFANGFRLEADVASLWTDLGQIESFPGTSSKLRTTTGMLNALYDFNDFGDFQPYVGAGIGIVRGETTTVANNFLSGDTEVANPVLGGNSVGASFKDGDTGLGWQLLAGLGYDITDNLTWDTSYRYMQSNDLDFDGSVAPAVAGVTQASQLTLEDVGAHALMTGFRYRFGSSPEPVVVVPVAPPPPPTKVCDDGTVVLTTERCPLPPPPPVETFVCWDGTTTVTDISQCPAQPVISESGNDMTQICSEQNRQEIIYYEFDRGQSPETRATIQRLLDTGQFCDVGSIRVVGHTDTSGSAAYNLALSRRRAADARSELVRQGINPDVITSEGKGETEPFVQTGDGVKEQLNRRTEVLVQLNTTGVRSDMMDSGMSSTMTSGSMSSGSMSSGSMSTTTSGSFGDSISSDDTFMMDGQRVRLDANGNFVPVN